MWVVTLTTGSFAGRRSTIGGHFNKLRALGPFRMFMMSEPGLIIPSTSGTGCIKIVEWADKAESPDGGIASCLGIK